MNARNLFHHLPKHASLLFVRLRSMGDCLLLTSPVRALKTEFPGFHVSILVDARFADCFGGNPDVDAVIPVHRKTAAVRQLLLRRFDAVINLHGGPTSLLYTLSARGLHVGGAHHQYRRLYSGLYPQPDQTVHTTESTVGTFRWLGLSGRAAPPLRFEPHPASAARVRTILGDTAAPYVVVHPASVFETKRWPAERYARLVEWLERRGLRAVVTCGPGEETVLGEVSRMQPDATVLAGLSIPELAELIRGARMYIGNDSGPMHLATAVGTPTVGIWGSSSSVRWHPWGVPHRVVQNSFVCNPCPGYRCLVATSPLCIESVTVEQVRTAVEQLLTIQPSSIGSRASC